MKKINDAGLTKADGVINLMDMALQPGSRGMKPGTPEAFSPMRIICYYPCPLCL